MKSDSQGVRYVQIWATATPTQAPMVSLKDPADPSLNYQQKSLLGVGNNSGQICPLLPGFVVFLLGGFLWKRRARKFSPHIPDAPGLRNEAQPVIGFRGHRSHLCRDKPLIYKF